MKKFFTCLAALAVMVLGACTQGPGIVTGIDSYHESITLADGEKFDCGRLDVKRGGGLVAPGYVAMVKHRPVSPTGNLADLSAKNQGLVAACDQGSQVVYAGHTEGALKIHVGVSTGGNDSTGGPAIAIAQSASGAEANADAGADSSSSGGSGGGGCSGGCK